MTEPPQDRVTDVAGTVSAWSADPIQYDPIMRGFAVLATATLLALPAEAQTERLQTSSPGNDDAFIRALSQVPQNTKVRIRTGPTFLEGSYIGFNEQGVLLQSPPTSSPIPFASIDEMWRRTRSSLQGALIGGAIGAVLVGTFGILVVRGFCESSDGCSDDYPTAALFGGAIGAAGGGLLGAGVGLLVMKWKRIHP